MSEALRVPFTERVNSRKKALSDSDVEKLKYAASILDRDSDDRPVSKLLDKIAQHSSIIISKSDMELLHTIPDRLVAVIVKIAQDGLQDLCGDVREIRQDMLAAKDQEGESKGKHLELGLADIDIMEDAMIEQSKEIAALGSLTREIHEILLNHLPKSLQRSNGRA